MDWTRTQQIYLSIDSLLIIIALYTTSPKIFYICHICSSIHSSLDTPGSACHCSRSCTAYPWYLQCFVAKNLREPQLIIAAPPRWSKPRELFLPPVSPSSLCQDSSSQQVSARGHYLARYITTVKNRERTDHDGSGRSRRIAAMKECINDFGDLRP